MRQVTVAGAITSRIKSVIEKYYEKTGYDDLRVTILDKNKKEATLDIHVDIDSIDVYFQFPGSSRYYANVEVTIMISPVLNTSDNQYNSIPDNTSDDNPSKEKGTISNFTEEVSTIVSNISYSNKLLDKDEETGAFVMLIACDFVRIAYEAGAYVSSEIDFLFRVDVCPQLEKPKTVKLQGSHVLLKAPRLPLPPEKPILPDNNDITFEIIESTLD